MSSLNCVPSNTKTSYIKNKCEISSPLTYLCDNETSECNQEYGSNLQCNKHLDYASKNKRNGRSKSNSVNHSHHNNSRIVKKSNGVFMNFIPDGFDSNPSYNNSKAIIPWNGDAIQDRFSSSHFSHDELPQYSGRSKNSNKNIVEDSDDISANLRNNVQQSEEKIKVVHDERYEGSSGSREETKSQFGNDLKDSCMITEESEINPHQPAESQHELPFQKNIFNIQTRTLDQSRSSQRNNCIDFENVIHATFDSKGFLNQQVLKVPNTISHNTSVETVIKNDKLQAKEQSFMRVINEAIASFSNQTISKPCSKERQTNFESQLWVNTQNELIRQNYELREDNKILVMKNDKLQEIVEEKDQLIEELKKRINSLSITLKECEIRLSHTTEMYAREKKEKENTAIAFNRILNKFTTDDSNSIKFLQHNMQLTHASPSIRLNRVSGYDNHQALINIYHNDEDDIYGDKELINERRNSNSRMNTSCVNANQRTLYTNNSNLITRHGETVSTGFINNNESYDFNPRDMEEMGSIHS